MVNYMSHNQQERMPEPYNPLTAWNKQVPAFLASIDEFGHDETSRLIKEKVDGFRSQLENPADNGNPDYNEFSTECSKIFVNHLPSFQAPKAKILVRVFFTSLLIIACLIFAIGLIMIMLAELPAVMGLVNITCYHVKGLATTAAYLGGAGGTLMAIGMFFPQVVATTLLKNFTDSVKPPEAESTSATARS